MQSQFNPLMEIDMKHLAIHSFYNNRNLTVFVLPWV